MSRGRPRTRIAILDRQRLGEALSTIIGATFNGKLTEAARVIGIERSLLSRLVSGSAGSLSVNDLSALRRALPREQFLPIERAVYPEHVIELLLAYDSWIAFERSRLLDRESMPDTLIVRALSTVLAWDSQRLLEYHHLRGVISEKFGDVVRKFDDFLISRRHFQDRGDLAYVRILAPLLDSLESGHIERRWQELSDRQFRAFVEAGIEREKILLDRSPDLQRAQEVAERDPLDLIALYGQLWDTRAFLGRNVHPLVQKWIAIRMKEVREPNSDDHAD